MGTAIDQNTRFEGHERASAYGKNGLCWMKMMKKLHDTLKYIKYGSVLKFGYPKIKDFPITKYYKSSINGWYPRTSHRFHVSMTTNGAPGGKN